MPNTVYRNDLIFEMVVGEEFDPIAIQLIDDDNCLVDVSSVASVVCTVYFDRDLRKEAFSKAGSVDTVESVLSCTLVEADTLYLNGGDYYCRFKFTDNSKIRYAPQAGGVIQVRIVK